MTEEEAEELFAAALREHGVEQCLACGKPIDRGDVAWNGIGQTEAGTEYSVIEIICQRCDTEVARWTSWYSADDFVEMAERVLEDW